MAPQQSPSQVRVQDPILTSHAHGYRHPARVGTLLHPIVPVDISGGLVLEFGKESFRRYNSRRAPGANTKRINFGYLGKPFSLKQESLESPLPREFIRDAAVMPGIDLGKQRTTGLMANITLQHEIACGEADTNTANYPASNREALSGTDKFSNAASTPLITIEDAREAIRAQIGEYPNVMIAGPQPHKSIKTHEDIIDRFKYTSPDSITEAMLAQLFEVEVYRCGKGIYVNDADANVDIWGDNIVLAYVPPESMNLEARYAPSDMLTFETPSFGYTYAMRGHPVVEEPYYDNSAKSWIYGATFEYDVNITGMAAGFLLSTVTA